nr:MAG TPA: hypothetical protein [Crassvirales sp.]
MISIYILYASSLRGGARMELDLRPSTKSLPPPLNEMEPNS